MLEDLELIGTGFAVVMLVLAAMWGICAMIGSFFIRAEKAAEAAAATAAAVVPVAAPMTAAVSQGVPPHHLAAISAAVSHSLGSAYRVTRVAAPAHKVSDWPQEGRIETFSMRRIRTAWGPTHPNLGGETPNTLRGQNE